MKIINLLEGSEVLFHAVSNHAIESVLSSGKILLSQLFSNASEISAIRTAYGDAKTKLYFLSLARSMKSEFIMNMSGITQCIFQFSGRKLSRFGRIIPINYFNNSDRDEDVDEMEDRLVSDRGFIPISMCECVHVVCTDKLLGRFKIMQEMYGVNIKFYRTVREMKLMRNSMTLAERIGDLSDGEINRQTFGTSQDDFGREKSYMLAKQAIEDYINNPGSTEMETRDIGEAGEVLRRTTMNKMMWILRVFNPEEGHKFAVDLRKRGYNTPEELDKLRKNVFVWVDHVISKRK